MTTPREKLVIEKVRKHLNHPPSSVPLPRPPVLPPRPLGPIDQEINRFIEEMGRLSGVAKRVKTSQVADELKNLIKDQNIRQACLWQTPRIKNLNIATVLIQCEVEVVPPEADLSRLASCDLGITEADFVLSETGTIGLCSDNEKPRSVSLLPRIHLALIHPSSFRADLHQIFEESIHQNYLVLITGPSRTADIELTVALGVHGPKDLFAWVLTE